MNEQQRKQWIFLRLKHSLQVLALPAAAQVSLFPDFVLKADELVLNFDHWRHCAVENYHSEMTAAQLDSLATLDAHIGGPNSVGDETVWEESALYSHPFWEEIRRLSVHALKAFRWSQEMPPDYRHEYVPSQR